MDTKFISSELIPLSFQTPRITGIKVFDKNVLQDEIVAEVNVSYFGDAELAVSINGIEGGIRNIEFHATVRIVLKHLIPAPPLLSGIEISFMKCPTYDFELTTALAPLDMFASGDLLRTIITDQLTNRLVYPNKVYIKLKKIESKEKSEIEGVIRCVISSVDELVGIDGMTLSATVQLGSQSSTSSSVLIQDGSAALDYEIDLVKYAKDDNFTIVFDISNEGGLVTSLKQSFDLESLAPTGTLEGKYPLYEPGSVTIKLTSLTLSSDRGDLSTDNFRSSALLEVFVDSVRKIPKHITSLTAQFTVGNHSRQMNVLPASSSNLNKHLTFLLVDPENDSLTVKLIDDLTSLDIAQFIYNIPELIARKEMQHDQQAFPLPQHSHDYEVFMSLKLRALTSSGVL